MRGTFTISWGEWGGFYCNNGRLCLGWIAFTVWRYDIDDVLEAGLGAIKTRGLANAVAMYERNTSDQK